MTEDELQVILVNYDPSGTGQVIAIAELEEDFQNADGLKTELAAPRLENKKSQLRGAGGDSRKEPDGPRKPEHLQTLDRFRQELELINSAAKSRHSSVYSWFRECSKDGKTLQEYEWKRAIDSLKISAFTEEPNLSLRVYRSLRSERETALDIQELKVLFESIDKAESRLRFTDEQVLEKIVRAYEGDDYYVYNKPIGSAGYRDGLIPLAEMAALLLGPDRSLEQRDIEAMLKRYARDDKRETAVNVEKFRQAFRRMAKERAIPVGEYKPPLEKERSPRDRQGKRGLGGGSGAGRTEDRDPPAKDTKFEAL